MVILSNLENIISKTVDALGFELVHCAVYTKGEKTVLRVYIDHPASVAVTIDNCLKVARQIDAALQAETSITKKYHIEVSSPGLDRLVIKPEHYRRFIGRQVRIKLRKGVHGKQCFIGKLLDATRAQLKLLAEDETIELPLENIEKANLVPDIRG